MKWIFVHQIMKPGLYLCRTDKDMIGNSWLTVVGVNNDGVYFLNDWTGKHEQKLHCPMNKNLLLFGPIPE